MSRLFEISWGFWRKLCGLSMVPVKEHYEIKVEPAN
jgi:hypothetical protein